MQLVRDRRVNSSKGGFEKVNSGAAGVLPAGAAVPHNTPHLFDERPINLDGFTLRARDVEVVGKPNIGQWAAALDFVIGVEDAGPFWIGALWNYGEGRKEWRDKLEQALIERGHPLLRKTLSNYGYIVRTLSSKVKALAPSISHANAVIGLEPDEQTEFMEQARTEALTVRDLTLKIQASHRRKVLDGRADTMHTVEVTVQMHIEAPNVTLAQDQGWQAVKAAIGAIKGAKVVASVVKA